MQLGNNHHINQLGRSFPALMMPVFRMAHRLHEGFRERPVLKYRAPDIGAEFVDGMVQVSVIGEQIDVVLGLYQHRNHPDIMQQPRQ